MVKLSKTIKKEKIDFTLWPNPDQDLPVVQILQDGSVNFDGLIEYIKYLVKSLEEARDELAKLKTKLKDVEAAMNEEIRSEEPKFKGWGEQSTDSD